jgi:hypothetical protein
VAELSRRDRLEYLAQDPLSLPEIAPLLCKSCHYCTCHRNPQNYFKNEYLKRELHDHLKFDKQDKCWEVDLVENEKLDSLNPRIGAEMSKKRFLSMWKRAKRHGVWSSVVEKFDKELKAKTWVKVSEMKKRDPDFNHNHPASYMTLDYALKKPDLENPSARCGVRLVGDQSMTQKVKGESLSFNQCLEAGDSRLTKLSDAMNTFMHGKKAAIGDIEHAFFSIRNSPRL